MLMRIFYISAIAKAARQLAHWAMSLVRRAADGKRA